MGPAARRQGASRNSHPQLVIGHWDLVIPRDYSRTCSRIIRAKAPCGRRGCSCRCCFPSTPSPAFSLTGLGPRTRLVRPFLGSENLVCCAEGGVVKRLIDVDPEIAEVVRLETDRQGSKLELIASENFVGQAVMEAAGSPLTTKQAG